MKAGGRSVRFIYRTFKLPHEIFPKTFHRIHQALKSFTSRTLLDVMLPISFHAGLPLAQKLKGGQGHVNGAMRNGSMVTRRSYWDILRLTVDALRVAPFCDLSRNCLAAKLCRSRPPILGLIARRLDLRNDGWGSRSTPLI